MVSKAAIVVVVVVVAGGTRYLGEIKGRRNLYQVLRDLRLLWEPRKDVSI